MDGADVDGENDNDKGPMDEDETVDVQGKAPMKEDDEKISTKPTVKPIQGSDDDSWKLYVVHPRFGPFEVHEGVHVVADRFLVVEVGRIGFMYITLYANVRHAIRILVMHLWGDDPVMYFPVLDILSPIISQLRWEIFVGGIQPYDYPNVAADELNKPANSADLGGVNVHEYQEPVRPRVNVPRARPTSIRVTRSRTQSVIQGTQSHTRK